MNSAIMDLYFFKEIERLEEQDKAKKSSKNQNGG
jgi:hypothetical protein